MELDNAFSRIETYNLSKVDNKVKILRLCYNPLVEITGFLHDGIEELDLSFTPLLYFDFDCIKRCSKLRVLQLTKKVKYVNQHLISGMPLLRIYQTYSQGYFR